MTTQHLPLDSPAKSLANSRSSRPRGSRKMVVGILIALVVVLVPLALWLLTERSEQGAIRELPQTERRALYERTLSTLETTCAARTIDGLAGFCREQAEMIVRFPECDQRCTAVTQRWLNPRR